MPDAGLPIDDDVDLETESHLGTEADSATDDNVLGDADEDGIIDSADNCPDDHNPDQADENGNGKGDACDSNLSFEPTYELLKYDPEKSYGGVTLFAVQGGEKTFTHPDWRDFGYMAVIPMAANGPGDNEIIPSWVYSDMTGGAFSYVDLLPNGNLLTIRGADAGEVLEEIDPLVPRTISRYDDVMVNHAFALLPDGNTLFIWSEFIEHELYGVDIDRDDIKEMRVESVRVIDPDGNNLWEWDVFEQDPDAPIASAYVAFTEWWSNCNAVSFVPSEDWTDATPLEGDVYLNCRLLNRLYKINYPSGNLEWIMGEGGDFGDGFFHHSHEPQITFDVDDEGRRTNTRILLYDNRESPPLGTALVCPPDETCPDNITRFSRVMEVVVDPDLNAEIVWKWPSPSRPDFLQYQFYSPIGGGVSTLPNGNVLITNATEGGNPFLDIMCWGRLLEVKRDGTLTGAEVVWDVRFNDSYGSYRAVRLPEESISGWNSQLLQH